MSLRPVFLPNTSAFLHSKSVVHTYTYLRFVRECVGGGGVGGVGGIECAMELI